MKLLEILVEKLDEWPYGYTHLVQEYDGMFYGVNPLDGDQLGELSCQAGFWYGGSYPDFSEGSFSASAVADDYDTAIVTIEDYELAKYGIKPVGQPDQK